MNVLSRFSSTPLKQLIVASLACLPLGSACSSDDSASEEPVTLTVTIASLDGGSPSKPVALHCDGTLALTVSISSEPQKRPFLLLPSPACGSAARCGYVRFRGLAADGAELARTNVAALTGLLRLPSERLADLTRVEATLISGVTDEAIVNPDQQEASTSLDADFQPPSDCAPEQEPGSAGAGGVAAVPNGGAGGETEPSNAGGAGGTGNEPSGGMAGTGGAEPGSPLGGAGGALPATNAGAGGS